MSSNGLTVSGLNNSMAETSINENSGSVFADSEEPTPVNQPSNPSDGDSTSLTDVPFLLNATMFLARLDSTVRRLAASLDAKVNTGTAISCHDQQLFLASCDQALGVLYRIDNQTCLESFGTGDRCFASKRLHNRTTIDVRMKALSSERHEVVAKSIQGVLKAMASGKTTQVPTETSCTSVEVQKVMSAAPSKEDDESFYPDPLLSSLLSLPGGPELPLDIKSLKALSSPLPQTTLAGKITSLVTLNEAGLGEIAKNADVVDLVLADAGIPSLIGQKACIKYAAPAEPGLGLFGKLPVEIRDDIYKQFLIDDDIGQRFFDISHLHEDQLAFLQTSKSIWTEASPIFWSQTMIYSDYCDHRSGCWTWNPYFDNMRRACVSIYPRDPGTDVMPHWRDSLRSIPDAFRNLEELTLIFEPEMSNKRDPVDKDYGPDSELVEVEYELLLNPDFRFPRVKICGFAMDDAAQNEDVKYRVEMLEWALSYG